MNDFLYALLRDLAFKKVKNEFVGSLAGADMIRDLGTIEDFRILCQKYEIEIELKNEQK